MHYSLSTLEKTFDREEWEYRWLVLEHFRFGEECISMIKALQHKPMASEIMERILCPSFQLSQGTGLVSPLSPIMFCLSHEPLALYCMQMTFFYIYLILKTP